MDCFQLDEIKVFLTTDIQFRLDKLDEFYKRADIIFQDCETQNSSMVHAHYDDIDFTKKNQKKMCVPLRTRAASRCKKKDFLQFVRSNFWIFFRFTLNPGILAV